MYPLVVVVFLRVVDMFPYEMTVPFVVDLFPIGAIMSVFVVLPFAYIVN